MSMRGAYPTSRRCLGLKQVYPGRYDPNFILDLKQREAVTFSHCVRPSCVWSWMLPRGVMRTFPVGP